MNNGSSLTVAIPTILALVLALALAPGMAHAAETPRDTETDHVDAFDDVGPRTFAVAANVGTEGLQPAGPRIGAELDLGLGDAAALSLRGDWLALAATERSGGYGISLGVPMFPGRVPFHGLYVHPRATWERLEGAAGASVEAAGVTLTVGWAWTSRWGGTLRLGLGAAYETAVGGGASSVIGSALGLQPAADAAAGWVF